MGAVTRTGSARRVRHVSVRRAPKPLTPIEGCAARLVAVSVHFGSSAVLRNVSLEIMAGSYLEVRGSNGSGKTTLLRVLAGSCPPVGGRRDAVRPIAYVPAAIEPPALSVRSWLGAVRARRGSVFDALEVLGFEGDLDRSFRRLSFGNFRKVLLADAFSSDAALVVVDEAREGLDDVGIRGLDELVSRGRSHGVAFVVADQVAHPAPAQARLVIVANGAVIDASPAAGSATGASATVTLSFTGPAERMTDLERQATTLGFARTGDD